MIDKCNAIVRGPNRLQLAIKGPKVLAGFEKLRCFFVEVAYCKLQLLLRKRVPNLCQDGNTGIALRLTGLQSI